MLTKVDRRGTGCIKWDRAYLQRLCANPDAEAFWIADMDIASPAEASQAVMEIARGGAYGYPAFETLKDDILGFIKARHGYEADPRGLVISRGVLMSLALLLEGTEGSVVIPFPAYKPFVSICSLQKRQIIQWHLGYDSQQGGFYLNLDELESLLRTHHPGVLVFCSPHNPSGCVWAEDELKALCMLCKAYGVLIISDEIHADLVYEGSRHTLMDKVARSLEIDAVTLMAPSKTFNIAGEHFSYCLFSRQQRAAWLEGRLAALFCNEPSLVGGTLAHACLTKGGAWLDEAVQLFRDNAAFIQSYFQSNVPQLRLTSPQASFICFMDCSAIRKRVSLDAKAFTDLYDPSLSPEGSELTRFFGIRASCAFNAGSWFGEGYDDFVRFNYATDRNTLERALERIRKAVSMLPTI